MALKKKYGKMKFIYLLTNNIWLFISDIDMGLTKLYLSVQPDQKKHCIPLSSELQK